MCLKKKVKEEIYLLKTFNVVKKPGSVSALSQNAGSGSALNRIQNTDECTLPFIPSSSMKVLGKKDPTCQGTKNIGSY